MYLRILMLTVAILLNACMTNEFASFGPEIPPSGDFAAPVLFCPDSSFVGDFTIQWTRSDSGASYQLQESQTPGFAEATELYRGTDTSYAVKGRQLGTILYYRVRATLQSQTSAWSSSHAVALVLLGWRLRTSSTSVTLRSVQMLDARTAIIVGDNGTILRTDDGGVSWTSVACPTSSTLNSVAFFGTQVGYAVGEGGVILKTTDGGLSWILQPSGTSTALNAVVATTPLKAVAVGSYELGPSPSPQQPPIFAVVTLHTSDGGQNWNMVPAANATSWFLGTAFTDSLVGVAVGGSHPLSGSLTCRTTDGGLSWNYFASLTIGLLECAQFISENECLIGGHSYTEAQTPMSFVLRSSDQGVSWTREDLSGPYRLRDLSFPTSAEGFAALDSGKMLHTSDGGRTWTEITTPTSANLRAVDFYDTENGIAVGDGGTVLTTQSGGD